MENQKNFLKVWKRAEQLYHNGYCISERGLQAILYAELQKKITDIHILVEPTWIVNEKTVKPDLVIAANNVITDIF